MGQFILFIICQVYFDLYKIFVLIGEYSIHAFYTVTKIKILAVFKQKIGEKYDDNKIKNFFIKTYKLYKK